MARATLTFIHVLVAVATVRLAHTAFQYGACCFVLRDKSIAARAVREPCSTLAPICVSSNGAASLSGVLTEGRVLARATCTLVDVQITVPTVARTGFAFHDLALARVLRYERVRTGTVCISCLA